MNETAEQYIVRILGYQQGKDPLKVMASTPGKIAKLIKGKTRSALAKRPEPTKWSVTEILGHLADTELAVSDRIRLVLGENGVAIKAYDQDVWMAFSKHAKTDPRFSLDVFRILRERNLLLLKRITPEMWENYGMHSERGRESVRRIVEMDAGHDINHLTQLERLLGRKKK